MRYIDVSGVGNSGKSALVDILRELDYIHVPHFQFEFDFIRTSNGLIDFRNNIVDQWSPVRSDIAYKLFIRQAKRMGTNPRFYNLYRLINSTSQRYDGYFNNKFLDHSLRFANSFIIGSYKGVWPYEDHIENRLILFFKKILYRLGKRNILLRNINLVESKNFDEKAKDYLDSLFKEITKKDTRYVVLNNGIEPFNPESGLKILGKKSKQIVVLRDPRDIYVSGMGSKNINKSDKKLVSNDNDGQSKSFLGTDNLEIFIKRYNHLCKNLYNDNNNQVHIVWFEDLCTKYEITLNRVLNFLEIDPKLHNNKLKYFNPSTSSSSVGLWKKYSKENEIALIENKLSKYLYKSI